MSDPCWLGCTKMHESQKVMGADSQNRLLYQTKSLQKELGFFLQNCGGAQFLKFSARSGGKRHKNDKKYAIFQNLLITRPKMLNAWNKCLIHHFGGCFARFLNSVLNFGRSKSHFFSLKKGHFQQKWPLLGTKKWDFERPKLRTESKNLAKHPTKWWIRHLFRAFSIFGRELSKFWKIAFFFSFLALFSPYKDRKLQKLRGATILQEKSQFLLQWLSWV